LYVITLRDGKFKKKEDEITAEKLKYFFTSSQKSVAA